MTLFTIHWENYFLDTNNLKYYCGDMEIFFRYYVIRFQQNIVWFYITGFYNMLVKFIDTSISESYICYKTLVGAHIATMKLERRKVLDEANDRVPFRAARAAN